MKIPHEKCMTKANLVFGLTANVALALPSVDLWKREAVDSWTTSGVKRPRPLEV